MHVDYIKSELSVDKAPLKEAWPGSHDDPFSISMLLIISAERLKRESPIFVYKPYNISSVSLGMIHYPLMSVVRVTCPVFKIFAPNRIFGIGEAIALQMPCTD